MLGVLVLGITGVSAATATYGGQGADYARINHDGSQANQDVTTEVQFDDNFNVGIDDNEELQGRWNHGIPQHATVTSVTVTLVVEETNPEIDVGIQLWSANKEKVLTNRENITSGWQTITFTETSGDLFDEIQAKITAGNKIKIEADFEDAEDGPYHNTAANVDYFGLEISYTYDGEAPVISVNHTPTYPMCSDDVEVCATVTDDSTISFVDITCTAGGTTITHSDISGNGNVYCEDFSSSTFGAIDGDDLVCTVTSEDVHSNAAQSGPTALATYDYANPIAEANGDYSCDEGNPVTLSSAGSTDNASGIASHLWSVTGSAILDDSTAANPILTCLDGDSIATVTLTVTDYVGLTGTDTATVNIKNVNPVADAHGPYPVNEGASVSLNGSAIDVTADMPSLDYDWDLDNDGFYNDSTSQTPSFSCSEDGTYTVGLKVTDKDGDSGTDTATINCANVAPEVDSLTLNDSSIYEEEWVTLDATVSDIGADDTTLDYVINWGDGNSDSGLTSNGIISENHKYLDNDVYTIRLTVTDNDELDSSESIINVTVNNLAPWNVDAGVDQSAVEGQSVCFSGSAADVAADTVTYSWNFGDASSDVLGQTPCHAYADNGVYTVTMTASDEDDGFDTDTLTVSVYDWGIQLDEGWNLISIPVVPENTAIDSVFEGIIDSISYEDDFTATILQYDAVENAWFKSRPNAGRNAFEWDSASELKQIVPGYGYWIKMNESTTLYGNEVEFAPQSQPTPFVEVASQTWNLVGKYEINPISINSTLAFESLEGQFFVGSLKGYNTVIGNLEPKSVLETGQGYWIRTTNFDDGDEVLIYEPITYIKY